MLKSTLVSMLARAFLAGETALEGVVKRASQVLGRRWRWLPPIARRYVGTYARGTRPRHKDVVAFLLRDTSFEDAASRYFRELSVAQWITPPQRMQPVAAARGWDIPAIETVGALAAWLELSPGELEWFADIKGLAYGPRLGHYHYRVLRKITGSLRLIEAPGPRLKQVQRRILAEILEKIPAHPAVHGFVKGRSIQTFAAPHTGQRVVLRMDLRDFFSSICGARIQTLFRTVGYPESVADLLGGLCTNAAPREIWNGNAHPLYARPHLPQGAPSSPALANLCAYRVDCRLTGLANAAGAVYSRYADDLAFSGDAAFDRGVERFATHAAAILMEEGFTVHHRKTRVMRRGVRQHLAGLVTNQKVNVIRADFERLKATLTNCARLGAESQNREAHASFREHLQGRVAFVESVNQAKGRRLRTIFERIDWGG